MSATDGRAAALAALAGGPIVDPMQDVGPTLTDVEYDAGHGGRSSRVVLSDRLPFKTSDGGTEVAVRGDKIKGLKSDDVKRLEDLGALAKTSDLDDPIDLTRPTDEPPPPPESPIPPGADAPITTPSPASSSSAADDYPADANLETSMAYVNNHAATQADVDALRAAEEAGKQRKTVLEALDHIEARMAEERERSDAGV